MFKRNLDHDRYMIAFERFQETLNKNKKRQKKSDIEIHLEYLEKKRIETLNKYCGFNAY